MTKKVGMGRLSTYKCGVCFCVKPLWGSAIWRHLLVSQGSSIALSEGVMLTLNINNNKQINFRTYDNNSLFATRLTRILQGSYSQWYSVFLTRDNFVSFSTSAVRRTCLLWVRIQGLKRKTPFTGLRSVRARPIDGLSGYKFKMEEFSIPVLL